METLRYWLIQVHLEKWLVKRTKSLDFPPLTVDYLFSALILLIGRQEGHPV